MELPEELVKLAEERIAPYDTEGLVIGAGNENGDIMIVGEAPGEQEAVEGKPFIGRAGKELDKQLEYLGLTREDVYITSAVRSRPYKWVKTNKKGTGGKRKANRKPNQKEILAHAPILDYQIAKMNPHLIIALGSVAYERLTGRKDKMTKIVGSPIETPVKKLIETDGKDYTYTEKSYTIIPLYHPAAVFYNPVIKDEIYQALDRVKDHLMK
ncbi:uracil-DNA glycosylase [Thalassobacillus devorans]|uniref:Uracil-DNA glycosylase n=2 Tax=Thalassobacillus devorans TaxID=279813 RepID=A0ABQ1PPN2_9BACI|nr:uracil-DNA glycosylase [Thalassobacillus devorans]NIK30382.1 DNA polymerase [Thalassobacillus devorans]GGD00711.1 uracil-DNA glycosylase [Thalassobacillus devorans]